MKIKLTIKELSFEGGMPKNLLSALLGNPIVDPEPEIIESEDARKVKKMKMEGNWKKKALKIIANM